MNQTDNKPLNDILDWRKEDEEGLREDWGWLTVTGLHWIDGGKHSLGSAADSAIQLPGEPLIPAHAADIIRTGNEVHLEIMEPGSVLKQGKPAVSGPLSFDGTQGERFVIGAQSFLVVRRGDRIGVRTWDNNSQQRKDYQGSDWFVADPAWRVTAHFVDFPEVRTIRWLNVIGDEKETVVSGEWRFTRKCRRGSVLCHA